MPADPSHDTLDAIVLVGRPASGKSEIIDFLTRLPERDRRRDYHLGMLDILDDFPLLWTWFEEDAMLERDFNRPRLHSDPDGYFLHNDLWRLLVRRLDLEYTKRLRQPGYHPVHTTLVEFSRGAEHGGYAAAFPHLSDELLGRAGVVYVRVSYEESLRKNRRRFNPDRPDSILEHGLSDEKMERLYREDDWSTFAPGDSGFFEVRSQDVPFVVFENQDDVTTGRPDLLAGRLKDTLGTLWELHSRRG
ncbi:MAG: hypothetical protein FJZ96_08940 [Chloroflexi bacterium]|nr:hypothetical protein [Chloroflexota bacterium]